MSKISAMMDTGKRSLMNSQTALQTVGHNIANKSTEGFSRQRVELQTNTPITEGNLQIGMGARAGVVTRVNNPWLEKQIQREGMSMGFQDSRADALGRVEQIYNEQNNKGLNQYMTDFFNSFRELSNNPESLASRTMVRESSVALTKDFGRVVGQLKAVQEDLDGQIKTTVEEVNQLSKEIASLNEKVQMVEVQGTPANDERDRRDLLLKKLGEKIDISWAEGRDGMVTVTAGRTAILVSGIGSSELKARQTDARDRVEVFFEGSSSTSANITEQITGGRIGGALDVRDKVIEDLLGHVDNMAYTLAKEVNTAHIEGFDKSGRNGVLFFDMPDQVKGAASVIGLNKTVFNDVGRIATGAQPGAAGDNTVANVISALQYRQVMDGGTSTLDDYYSTQVGQIGAVAQRAVKAQESQKNVISQLTNIRESISGVSLDEETTKMIEFQKTYDASARLIKTADEMFDTVLNLKRM
ncbi:flagellar hook-associated protein FlgK [Bdellovibrio bacteriovorus]|uniref:Flagellar hook-associated protein 1 n=1 Tax=Bdellovibrio bacteriovorus str. Tiberius TaxID=1069642 RepID=K7YRJ4_BDEBC|nr:flagellar hook-associated protein FlgK [Bdellovibrio bacteriovorus]AFY00228.1 FlgK, flagellar hook-associated protein [Bdellovibrio bacteriovorus str. Tiberius]